jgi:hypothetical protein
MKPTVRRRAIAALLLSSGVLTPIGCNVFRSVDRCAVDAECAEGFVCDKEGRYCFDPREPRPGVEASAEGGDSSVLDAPGDNVVEVPPPPCDLTAPYGDIHLVPGLEDSLANSARFSGDERTVLFSAFQKGCEIEGCADLYFAQRADRTARFGAPQPLPGSEMSVPNVSEYWPTMTSDELVLFFESARGVDGGHYVDRSRIWTATRASTQHDQFRNPYLQTVFRDSVGSEGAPYLHPNGTSLYFMSTGRSDGGFLDIFVAELGDLGSVASITPVSAVNTPAGEEMPVVTYDDLTLYFAREDSQLLKHIWASTRDKPDGGFGSPHPVSELNIADAGEEEFPSWVSNDHCRLYFVSNRPRTPDAGAGSYSLWGAERPPINAPRADAAR